MWYTKNRPFPSLVPTVFSVLEEPEDEVGRFPYSLKLTNICPKDKREFLIGLYVS